MQGGLLRSCGAGLTRRDAEGGEGRREEGCFAAVARVSRGGTQKEGKDAEGAASQLWRESHAEGGEGRREGCFAAQGEEE
ncbi:hypothetical protein SAMN05444359_1307 [Neolewinella agarilytica]|uniref:Uncharacterized protein n=1 Tax=Neolewinella agarilytica TaxID=478744 RepID=A0A1H9MLC5_9BACT|nr:hypothetical protein SAMN05444359_1307 [Neolewinella agarilytica]